MPRWAQIVLFLVVAIAIWSGLHVYVFRRLVTYLEPGPRLRLGLKLAFIALAALFPLTQILAHAFHAPAVKPLLWVAYVWMGLVTLLFCLVVSLDLGFGAAWLGRRLAGAGPASPTALAGWRRPAMLAALGLAMGAAAFAYWRAAAPPLVREATVALRGLAPALDGLRVVQLSDLHVGHLTGADFVARTVQQVNALAPDLVVITGDLIDEPVAQLGPALDALAGLKPRLGVYATVGNHEMYADPANFERALEERGIPVLRQRHVVLADALVLAGVDDPEALGGLSLPEAQRRALAGAPAGLPAVLLSHRPVAVAEAARSGVALMLAGHTHGGQLPPFHVLSRLVHRYMRDLHAVGDLTLYVSRGTGTWGPPMRLFAPPEIATLVLRAAPRAPVAATADATPER